MNTHHQDHPSTPVPDTLHRDTPPVCSADLKRRVMNEAGHMLDREQSFAWPGWARGAVAAVFMTVVIGVWFMPRIYLQDSAKSRAMELGADWLALAQETDGRWQPERWGGRDEFTVGLTGLALMALVQDHDVTHTDAVRNGIRYLVDTQQPSGAWSVEGSNRMYNQSMATLALLSARRRYPDSTVDRAIARSLRFMAEGQTPQGGWNYAGTSVGPANSGATLWPLYALAAASSEGFTEAETALRRGGGWLIGMMQADGGMTYQSAKRATDNATPTLLAMTSVFLKQIPYQGDSPRALNGKLAESARRHAQRDTTIDYYEEYFLARHLSETTPEQTADLLNALQNRLIERQVTGGEHRGSWSPDDHWSRIGGRLYTTALASLSLSIES